eukprot:TRINITY_DN1885_c0_g1_i1.p1 TRINITY_DN1885_c0_g1~~TRINITY_DN1885_c0_g1_i1.p1  ORF type:complete len:523 (-),score=155.37 TRINITY_DN1885_c0_g1_i1:79-1647(-)
MRLLKKSALLCVLCALSSSVIAEINFPSLQSLQQFFPGRSADIAIRPKFQSGSSFVADVFSGVRRAQHREGLPASITVLSEMVECSLGVSLGAEHDKELECMNNPFKLNRANLVFAIENLNSEQASKLTMLQRAQTVPVDSSHFYNEISFLNSLATGLFPAAHGVVAKEWINDNSVKKQAYQSSSAERAVPNVVDVLADRFSGDSWVLSFAKDLHNAMTLSSAKNSHHVDVVSIDDGCLKSTHGDLDVSEDDVLGFFLSDSSFKSEFSLSHSGIIQSSGTSLTVRVGDVEASFSFESPDKNFLEELAALSLIGRKVGGSTRRFRPLIEDDAPDFIGFTISGLKHIDVNSSKYVVALDLVDAAIKTALSGFAELYGARVGAQVVGVQSPSIEDKIKDSVLSIFPEASLSYLPLMYLRDQGMRKVSEVCSALRNVLEDYDVECPERRSLFVRHFGSLQSNSSSTNSTVSSSDIALYQISLWLSVVLILTLYAAVYGFVYMDNKYDNTLYTKFNPKAYGKVGPAK